MILVTSKVEVLDNAGGLGFTCVRLENGPRRRYGRLGEIIGIISASRKKYSQDRDEIDELNAARAARIAKRVKKSRKVKAKKKRRPNMRPYMGVLMTIKNITRRVNGENLRHDGNRVLTHTEPHKFGPAGKTQNIPNFIGTEIRCPILVELMVRQKTRDRFGTIVKMSRGMV